VLDVLEPEANDSQKSHSIVWVPCDSMAHVYNSNTSLLFSRDVTEPANICICRMRISCAESVGFGCRCGFVARSKLPAII